MLMTMPHLSYNPNLGTIHCSCFGTCETRTTHFWVSADDGESCVEVAVCLFCGVGSNMVVYSIPKPLWVLARHQARLYGLSV